MQLRERERKKKRDAERSMNGSGLELVMDVCREEEVVMIMDDRWIQRWGSGRGWWRGIVGWRGREISCTNRSCFGSTKG